MSALHILAVLHRLLMLHYHCRIFRAFHLGVESFMISITKEAAESERFGKPREYLCLTDVLGSWSNDAVSPTIDSGGN